MSDIISDASIKVGIDAEGVEVGLRKIEEGAARTKRTFDTLGKSDGISKMGDGADTAAAKFTFGTKGIIEAIEKRTAAMELGKRGTVEYFTALANKKGLDPAIFKPYLDQLDAVTRKTAEAAAEQSKLDNAASFLDGLRAKTAEIGKTASQLLEMQAAQLGVGEAAQPMIEQLRASEEASGSLTDALGFSKEALLGFAAGVAGAFSLGAIIAGVSAAIDSLADLDDMSQKTGSSVESLSRLQKVASVVGQDFGAVDGAVSKLAKGMAGLDEDSNKVVSALKRLGVSTEGLADKDPSDILIQASKALQGYADGAGKTALINDLLGKSGADLLPYLNDVSELVDGFGGASASAARNAADFQDNLGKLRTRADEFFTSLATLVIPSLADLTGAFSDAAASQNGLLDSTISEWADDAAIGIAFVVDKALMLGRIFSTVAGSVKAVAADVRVFGTAVQEYNPISYLNSVFNGKDPNSELRRVVDERNAILAESNKKLENLLETPVDGIEKSVRERIAGRTGTFQDAFGDKFMDAVEGSGKRALTAPDNDAAKKRADAVKAEADAYASLSESINERLTATAREAAGLVALTESQKLQINLDQQIFSGKLRLTPVHKAAYETKLKELAANEAAIASNKLLEESAKTVAKAVEELDDRRATELTNIIAEAAANEKLAETFGLSKREIELETLARKEKRLEQRKELELDEKEVAKLEREIAARRRNVAALGSIDTKELGKKAGEELDKFLDPARPKDFGQALIDAFGSAGSALGKLTNLLGEYGREQAQIDENRIKADKQFKAGKSTQIDFDKKIAQLNDMQTKNQLGSYGQMTSAAASFFGEQSRGYKALQAASQVFHAAELAMTLAELVPKGIAAILGQGQGDPYTAFARMAAMTALVAGLGVAIGGGSSGAGGAKAEDVQKSQGAGGVFGDTGAQSASIRRSLDLIEKNTFQGLDYSAGMLSALRNIESSMGGVANILIGTPGVVNGENLNIQEGTIKRGSAGSVATGSAIGGALGSFFSPLGTIIGSTIGAAIGKLWGKTTQNVVDSGIKFGGSLDALQMGQGVSQYASVDTTKSSWFGLKKKTSNSVQTQAIGGELADQFGLIFTSLEETLKAAAVGMDLGADSVAAALSNLVIKTSTISLKGLQGDDLTAALNAVISQALDQVAAAAFPSFDAFRKVGEGYAETVVRVANNFQAINVVFESFGKVFGKVGLESIAARERLIEMSGGLEKFSAQGEYFLTNFFTPTEQSAALKKRIQPTLSQFGLSTEGADASKVFRDFVVGLDTTTAAGAEAYATLMKIAPAFNEIVKAGKDELEERRSLQDQLDNLTMSSAQLLKKQREALMGSNRALFDQVQAATAAKAAQESAKSSLGDVISRMKSFGQSARSLRDGLTTGALSTLTPEQKYAESRKQYQVTLAAAKAGDADAQGKFSAMATAFLDASQKINGGDSMYAADFADVLKTSDEISRWADGQVDVAQASLKALNAQVEALGQLNATMLVIAGGGAGGIGPLTPPPPRPFADGPNYAGMGTANTVPLVAEIKALRENNERMATELAGMRADQKQIAAASIEANAKVTLLASKMGTEGMERAMVNQAWQEQNSKVKPR